MIYNTKTPSNIVCTKVGLNVLNCKINMTCNDYFSMPLMPN